jgi:hypothetical protein
MKIKVWTLIVAVVLTNLCLMTLPVSACACCSDEGEYRLGFSRPTEYQLSQLQEIRFGKTAHLIETQANVDDEIKAPSHPAESYAVSGSFNGNIWKLVLRDSGASGALTLPLPVKMWSYAVDTHDGQKSPGGGPMLYKEWRFEGSVTGTGFFKKGIIAPTKYFLVLQGRGNRCEEAGSFTHWRLEIIGRKARYAFYGELADASNAGAARYRTGSDSDRVLGARGIQRVGDYPLANATGFVPRPYLLLSLMTTKMNEDITLEWKERTVS